MFLTISDSKKNVVTEKCKQIPDFQSVYQSCHFESRWVVFVMLTNKVQGGFQSPYLTPRMIDFILLIFV